MKVYDLPKSRFYCMVTLKINKFNDVVTYSLAYNIYVRKSRKITLEKILKFQFFARLDGIVIPNRKQYNFLAFLFLLLFGLLCFSVMPKMIRGLSHFWWLKRLCSLVPECWTAAFRGKDMNLAGCSWAAPVKPVLGTLSWNDHGTWTDSTASDLPAEDTETNCARF